MLPEFQEEFETFLTRVRDSDPELTDVDLSEEDLNDEDGVANFFRTVF